MKEREGEEKKREYPLILTLSILFESKRPSFKNLELGAKAVHGNNEKKPLKSNSRKHPNEETHTVVSIPFGRRITNLMSNSSKNEKDSEREDCLGENVRRHVHANGPWRHVLDEVVERAIGAVIGPDHSVGFQDNGAWDGLRPCLFVDQ